MTDRISLTDVSRDAWLDMRRAHINASEVPIVVGEATWGSLAELYAEKKGLRPPKEDTGVLRRGRWGEAAVFEALADERPEWQVARSRLYVVDQERRQACTPDGFATAPDRDGIGIVQCKVVASSVFRQKWHDDPADDYSSASPPAPYLIQTIQEMRLNDVAWGVIAVVINGEFTWRFRLFDVERDPVIEDRIDAKCEKFFREYLDAGIMPPFEPLRDEALIKHLYPSDTGAVVDLAGDNRALTLVEDLTETQSALKRLHDQEKALKTELEGKLRDNTFGKLADGRWLSWKQQQRKAYAVEASSYRVLRILKDTPKEMRT